MFFVRWLAAARNTSGADEWLVLLEEVVLDLPRVVEAEPVGELDLVERVAARARTRRRPPTAWELQLVEDAELQGDLPQVCVGLSVPLRRDGRRQTHRLRIAQPLARHRAGLCSSPGPRCPATSSATWPSSAPATPASGRRTTCAAPTRRCASRCSRRRSPGSARRAATAAGARPCSPPSRPRLASEHGRDGRDRDAAGDVRHRRRGRPGQRRRRASTATSSKGGTTHFADGAGPPRASARRHRRRARRSASPTTTTAGSTPPRARDRIDVDGLLGAALHARTARRSIRRASPAASPTSSSARGVTLFERTPVQAIDGSTVRTEHGTVGADVVVRATEAFTAHPRRSAPRGRAHLLADGRDRAAPGRGLGRGRVDRPRDDVTDGRHLIIYGQRTADDRIAFGGRGAPYHFGSGDPVRLRPRRVGVRRPSPRARRARPPDERRPHHPRVGRSARRAARLASVVRLRPRRRAGVGGRLRRRRRRRPRTSPDARSPTSSRAPTLRSVACRGCSTVPGLGTRAAAMARPPRAHCARPQRRPGRTPHGPARKADRRAREGSWGLSEQRASGRPRHA